MTASLGETVMVCCWQTISGLLSGANTVVIFFFGTASFVSILSGIAAALVAALTSWYSIVAASCYDRLTRRWQDEVCSL